ncbi:MAG: hypothetical protein JRJ03_07075 [Deltaproteobacteria bacterium]|nr:hypothetical protein [Deltaproteobacteria bacterium]
MENFKSGNTPLIITVSLLSSSIWLFTHGKYINGDEAIIGLMAIKISQFADFPLFFWKAHYSGPIASYLVAPLHLIWKPSGLLLHSIVIPFHLFFSCGTYLLCRKWLNEKAAIVAGLMAALPPKLFPYSPLGGYTESVSFFPWIMLISLGMNHNEYSDIRTSTRFIGAGFLCGFAIWIFPFSISISLICFFFVCRGFGKRPLIVAVSGCLLALFPVIFYNALHPGASILRLMARPFAIDKHGFAELLSSKNIFQIVGTLFLNWVENSYQSLLNIPDYTLQLFQLSANYSIWNRVTGVISLIGVLAVVIFYFCKHENQKLVSSALFAIIWSSYLFLLIFGMNRYRYLIPVLTVIPFGIALILTKTPLFENRNLMIFALCLILLINGLSNFSNTSQKASNFSDLIQLLDSKGLRKGYANYFISYPLIYLSNERLIFTPVLHDPKNDRYPEYTYLVSKSDNPAFIFVNRNNETTFREQLSKYRISAKVLKWGAYRIFYELTPEIDPEKFNMSLGSIP